MPSFQTGSNVQVAYKKQADLGVPASGAGANVLRIAGGAGVKLAKQAIASAEIRSDGLSTRGRHGTQQVTAAYNAEASLGALDPIIEAIMRGTWDTNVLSKTQADFTSLTTAVDGFLMNTGSPIAMGFRVGDIIRAAGLPDAANNNRNLRDCGIVGEQDHDGRDADRERGRGQHLHADQAGQAADQSGHAAQVVFHDRGI